MLDCLEDLFIWEVLLLCCLETVISNLQHATISANVDNSSSLMHLDSLTSPLRADYIPSSSITLLDILQGSQFIMNNTNSFTCPAGAQVYDGINVPPYLVHTENIYKLLQVTTASYQCIPCSVGLYNLSSGTSSGIIPLPFNCSICPNGANCTNGRDAVYSLAGYWCSTSKQDSNVLQCTLCPEGYCCNDVDGCPWKESCRAGHAGILCGKCEDSYSEAFGTSACVSNRECKNTLIWMIPLAFALSIVFVIIMILLGIGEQPLWKSITYFMQGEVNLKYLWLEQL